jgi:hypothetical protein
MGEEHNFQPLVNVENVNGSDTCRICHVTLREHEECTVEGCEARAERFLDVKVSLPFFGEVDGHAPLCEAHAEALEGGVEGVSLA